MVSRQLPASSDVVIVGGGPAGAVAAHLLAAWGHAVLVFTKPESDAPTLAESIPPSCRKLFRAVGVLEAVDAAGFYRSTGNTVWWGDGESRSERFAEGAFGHQVERRRFDRLLRSQAEAAGARISERMVKRVEFAEGRAVVGVADGGGDTRVDAQIVLDCSGRAGVVARHGFRRYGDGPATLAIVAIWDRASGWPLSEPSHTLVEAYRDGWAWSVPVSASRRYLTVMVDPRATDLERGGNLADTYRVELAKTQRLAGLTEGATLAIEPWACDASVYAAERYSAPACLLVGDAASFIDPLSSFGVKKAIASAWMASIVANTCLTRPEMAEPARGFYAAREAEVVTSFARQAADYFGDAATAHDHPFWAGRSTVGDDLAGLGMQPPAAIDVETLRGDPTVRAAFGDLKQRSGIDFVPGDRLRIERQPGIAGREVVLEARLRLETPAIPPTAVRFVRGVDLPALVGMAGDCDQVPDLFEVYNDRHPEVGLPDFLGALSLLLAAGALKNR
ncbi:MAG: tryptophan 7-halogenase [Vicinamibacterales bacterium]|jgi:flavin-dependent dehydrogenase|nr:tryptophan 7-halogenase [Vicinamibacterales bacterium]MDP7471473.1 tryptophan 7-halogenase [Vicinamibacterales bacterium]HJO37986.1 tryptophan 7-halogenase [Vicinamibacterales bacterium]|tara:strand:- start:2333 stop:3850 length:1518 start_codon:yes stop_codon:yes gene_type:complete